MLTDYCRAGTPVFCTRPEVEAIFRRLLSEHAGTYVCCHCGKQGIDVTSQVDDMPGNDHHRQCCCGKCYRDTHPLLGPD